MKLIRKFISEEMLWFAFKIMPKNTDESMVINDFIIKYIQQFKKK